MLPRAVEVTKMPLVWESMTMNCCRGEDKE